MNSDIVLVNEAKDDLDAFMLLYDKYYKKILNYIYRKCRDIHISQDVTSQTFLNAMSSIKKFEPTHTNSFAGWIYKIAHNEFIRYQTKGQKYKVTMSNEAIQFYTYAPDDEIQQFEKQHEQSYLIKIIQSELAQIPYKQRQVIELKLLENLTYEEISYITQINVNTLKSQYKRGIEQIQVKIANQNLSTR